MSHVAPYGQRFEVLIEGVWTKVDGLLLTGLFKYGAVEYNDGKSLAAPWAWRNIGDTKSAREMT